MAEPDTIIELLRDVREILRDSARASAVQAEITAVANDRLGRALEDNDKMKDILVRIDASLIAAENAKSLAKANADLKQVEEKAVLLRIVDRLTTAASSSVGQRILMMVGYVLLGWLGLRFGIVAPGPAVTPNEVAPISAPAEGSSSTEGQNGYPE